MTPRDHRPPESPLLTILLMIAILALMGIGPLLLASLLGLPL